MKTEVRRRCQNQGLKTEDRSRLRNKGLKTEVRRRWQNNGLRQNHCSRGDSPREGDIEIEIEIETLEILEIPVGHITRTQLENIGATSEDSFLSWGW